MVFSALPEARASHRLPSRPADGGWRSRTQRVTSLKVCRSLVSESGQSRQSWQPRTNGACSPEVGGWGNRWGFLKQPVRMPGEGGYSEEGQGWTMRECPHLRARSWGRYKRDRKGIAGGEEDGGGCKAGRKNSWGFGGRTVNDPHTVD